MNWTQLRPEGAYYPENTGNLRESELFLDKLYMSSTLIITFGPNPAFFAALI